ncbi:MAG: DNA repair protein RecN [Candidatus Aminicenantes bacterium]|nr:DNA repair protein RecN [Candidatus Aminicenantes bacterium]
MLSYLRVENFAVVEKVELDFSGNLNVLTGETGAGKSILIDAIKFFLEKKTPPNSSRGPGKKLLVEAMFTKNDEELVFRREVNNGKSLCFLNGRMVPFVQLKEMAGKFLNIYGQNDHTFLLNPTNHRLFLDEFCANSDLLGKIAACYGELKKAIAELEDLKKQSEQVNEKLDFIHFQEAEIESLGMERGADEVLEQEVKILSSAEEITAKSGVLIEAFHQDDGSLYNKLAENLRNLEYLKGIYPDLESYVDEINKFYHLLPEFSDALSEKVGKVEYDEEELNKLEEKLLKLNRLKEKYRTGLDGLLDKLEALKEEKTRLLDMDFSKQDKQKEIDRLFVEYEKLNRRLRARRKEKAARLCKVIEKELAKLEMKKAKFSVQVEEIEPGPKTIGGTGTDRVEFYFSSNPGQPPGQIKNVASGGELSRLMLVLKSLIEEAGYSAYIFDEIDAGIGGKTAEFVGEKLKRIAEINQVICISHLPQIASFAGRHFLISKEFKQDETFSYVEKLSRKDRVREIGRLMVGSGIDEDVLKAAENLLVKNSG